MSAAVSSTAPQILPPPVCNQCEKPLETILKCGRCSSAIYCGKECQTNHWPTHKSVCRITIESSLPLYLQSISRNWNSPEKQKLNQQYQKEVWPHLAERHKNDRSPLARMVQLKEGDIVFDLGAGGGFLTRDFLAKGCNVTAIDYFKGFSEYMNRLGLPNQKNLTVVEKSLSVDLLPGDETVSLIAAEAVLFYCDPKTVIPILEQAHKSLKKGGVLSVTLQDISRATEEQKKLMEESSWAIPSIKTGEKYFNELGFETLVLPSMSDPRVAFICTKK